VHGDARKLRGKENPMLHFALPMPFDCLVESVCKIYRNPEKSDPDQLSHWKGASGVRRGKEK
jgi:hypothetical protein